MPLCIDYRWTLEANEDGARELVRKMRKAAVKLPFKRISRILEDTWGPKQHPKSRSKDLKGVMRRFAARWFVQAEDDDAHMQLVLPEWSCFFSAELNGCDPACFGLARFPARVDENTEYRELAFDTHLEGKCAFQCKVETLYAGLPQFGGWKNFLKQHKTVLRMLECVEKLGLAPVVWDAGMYWETTDEELLRTELEKSTAILASVMGEIKDHVGTNLTQLPPKGQGKKKPRSKLNPLLDHPEFERLEAKGQEIVEESQRNMPPWMREMLEGGEDDRSEEWKRGTK